MTATLSPEYEEGEGMGRSGAYSLLVLVLVTRSFRESKESLGKAVFGRRLRRKRGLGLQACDPLPEVANNNIFNNLSSTCGRHFLWRH